jgi:hypothetical protein
MRYLGFVVVAFCLAFGSASGAEKFQIRDTADLVAACDVDPGAFGAETSIAFCHGFMVGAIRYYFAATPEGSRLVCAPTPTPSRMAVMSDFVQWANANPQHREADAVESLFRYLEEKFPCRY